MSTEPKLGTCDRHPGLHALGYFAGKPTFDLCVNWCEGESAAAQPSETPNLDLTPGGRGECVGCSIRTNYICPICKIKGGKIRWLCESPQCREKHEEQGCMRTPKPFETAPNTHPEDGGPKEIAFERAESEAVLPAAETAPQDKCARCGCDRPTHEVEISRNGTRSGYCYAHPQDCPSFEPSRAETAMTARQFDEKFRFDIDTYSGVLEFAEAYAAHVREATQGDYQALHEKYIAAVLELSKLRVKPIVDKEKQGEY